MKVLVLTSGGDAPGMNKVLSQLYRAFGGKLYACRGGYRGLINNDIVTIREFHPNKFAKEAGSSIKCSRCYAFKEKEGFEKGLENAKRFDAVIVLGGNGSLKGAKELAKHGIKTIFIPATIDNDVEISQYSLGFHTAVKAGAQLYKNTMPTMEAFDRCAVFEVMGRNCGKIAEGVAKICNPTFLVTKNEDIDYDKFSQSIINEKESGKSSSIIIKENLIKIDEFISNLKEKCENVEFRGIVVGYTQRGSKPSNVDIKFAKSFARKTIKALSNKTTNCQAIIVKDGKVKIEIV